MQSRLLVMLWFSFLAVLTFDACADAKGQATIGVLAYSDFVPDRTQPQQGQQIGLPSTLADRIIEHLSNSKRFILVERSALRRLVLEQRFGQDAGDTDLDRTLNKAIDTMENLDGGAALIGPGSGTSQGRVVSGAGAVGTTGVLAEHNDLIKDFKDLGSAVGADYLVFGNLEKLQHSTKQTAVPYSDSGRKVTTNQVDARLRLRVIDTNSGAVAGATSIRTKLSESLFEGRVSESDQYTFFDHLGRLAAAKVLDVTFPARLVSINPMVISRGVNDGVSSNDRYLIKREGKQIKDANGLVIGSLKSDIGRVIVTDPQETLSVVKPVTAAEFKAGDLAVLDVQNGIESSATPSPSNIPLNKSVAASQARKAIPRLAVGLIKTDSTAWLGPDRQRHTAIFTDTMISRLAQTKRFQMIDRQEVDQLLKEQQAQAMTGNRDMASPMGSLKGADYLVYGSIASFSIEEQSIKLPNSSRIMKKKVGFVEGNMRIVDARSGDVMTSRKIVLKEDVPLSEVDSRVLTALADAYADQAVLILMDAIYPVKVAHVSADGMVYVNRGNDGGLYVGETLDAFKPGQEIIDPDTGVSLGVEETVLGQIEVVEVEDARSKARLTVGGSLSKGDLLKRTLDNKGKRASVAQHSQATKPHHTGGSIAASKSADGTDKPQAKATIAMGVMRYRDTANTSGIRHAPSLIRQMSDEMISKLTNTNRFSVMERQEVDQVLDEKAFDAVASGGDIEARLRELEGADYLIHGEVKNFYIKSVSKKVPYLDKMETVTTGTVDGMFRIVDVHTGRIASSEQVRIDEEVNLPEASAEITGRLMESYTTEAVRKIVARLYPIKVLGVSADGLVYLNRGLDSGLKKGDLFDLMRPGQELIDPDTGRSFGAAESKVGIVELIAIEANRSRAQLISGTEAKSGDVLRKSQIIQKKPEPVTLQPAW